MNDTAAIAVAPHSGAAPKRYLHGTHRTCTPQETLARVQPLLAGMGITRVANVTGLDRIGVPVAMVYRPNARSETISQGKGLTLDAAKASGVMESIEGWHAERIVKPLKLASTAELRAEHRLIDIARLPRARDSGYSVSLPLLWIEGNDLMGGGALWLPFELASTNYTLPLPPGMGAFQSNTNGLASGNHWLEAVSHALCEVVERDARTLWEHRPPQRRERTLVDAESVDDAACAGLIAQMKCAGLEVRIWDITTDVGIASFVCMVADPDNPEIDPEFGSGCHPARHVALMRALTEACQARIIYIAGARDQYDPGMYRAGSRAQRKALARSLMGAPAQQRAFTHVPTYESTSIDDDLKWMLARLRAVGVEQVAAVDLTRDAIGIPVAKVIVPGLEGATDHDYTPGARARRDFGGLA